MLLKHISKFLICFIPANWFFSVLLLHITLVGSIQPDFGIYLLI